MSKATNSIVSAVLLSASAWALAAGGEPPGSGYGAPPPADRTAKDPDSYGEMVKRKLASGITNMAGGWIEVPKNMINTANAGATGRTAYSGDMFDYGHVLLGVTGGGLKGALHMVGRTLAGLVDFATFFIPTKPITNPAFIWENFYTDTQYGPYFKVERPDKPPQRAAARPAAGR
ncbi:exosortase system-associated protein, TIGR04073 family [Candidatus Methylocalor cossyra]|uniref:Exosortase system-associated protein, TIGR04073 family n=1 Tax=Candidatus Methylocalor cossyra TaxID=3108543 RepID=A0ABM9NHV9_9GAMM